MQSLNLADVALRVALHDADVSVNYEVVPLPPRTGLRPPVSRWTLLHAAVYDRDLALDLVAAALTVLDPRVRRGRAAAPLLRLCVDVRRDEFLRTDRLLLPADVRFWLTHAFHLRLLSLHAPVDPARTVLALRRPN